MAYMYKNTVAIEHDAIKMQTHLSRRPLAFVTVQCSFNGD